MDELYIDKLSGEEFEDYLFNLFKNLGYEVESTPASNDYGADLIITKSNEKIVVQAKRYSSPVGISAVQEVIGAKNYYNANKCLVVTNNYFTPNAIELAKCNNVELWDRDILIQKAILSVNPKFDKEQSFQLQQIKDYINNCDDELLPIAIALVVKEEMPYISYLQRKLKISYTRAIKLIEEMENMGIISGYNESKPRKVLLSISELEKLNIANLDYDINLQKLKSKRSILNIILGAIFSLLISSILSFIFILNIDNPLLGTISVLILIILSFKVGFLLADKIFKFNKK